MVQSAEEEIEAAGEFPQRLKERVSAEMPGSEVLWSGLEILAQEMLSRAVRSKIVPRPSSKRCGAILAHITVGLAIRQIEPLAGERAASMREIALGQHVIPNRDSVDKLLRYETAIDRNLGRALDRLEPLQRRRQGETVLPSLD